jgi:hypothetical protein
MVESAKVTHAGAGSPKGPAPRVVLEREPAAADSDTATLQTVKRMCTYIRESIPDEKVRAAADYAWKRFGCGIDTPAMKCWGVFWWLKHSIAFRLDEATMFRIGERDQQDLLISPAVLVRMKNPAEDCDGFTMLCAAMLGALGVPVVIATVAANRSEPDRWSHVFPCALLPGDQVMPLDASHGSAPGWMVPPQDIFRWQSWSLDAEPVDVRPLAHGGLHGYVRRGRGFRGLGDYGDGSDNVITPTDPFVIPTTTPVNFGTPTPSSSWDPTLQNIATQSVGILRAVVTPPAYQQSIGPNGQVLTTVRNTASPSTALMAGAGLPGLGTNTILYVGGALLAGVLIFSLAKGRG